APSASPQSFFDRREGLGLLARMARPRADVREAELLQELADRALVIDHAEALLDHPPQGDPEPAHHPALRPTRPRLDDLGQGGQLIRRKAPPMPLRADVLQPVRAFGVE